MKVFDLICNKPGSDKALTYIESSSISTDAQSKASSVMKAINIIGNQLIGHQDIDKDHLSSIGSVLIDMADIADNLYYISRAYSFDAGKSYFSDKSNFSINKTESSNE